MPLPKPIKNLKIAILVPSYKRPEYTKACLESIRTAQEYPKDVEVFTPIHNSLRSVIIDFFDKTQDCDFICKVDNDCLVPKNWLNDILEVFDKYPVDILSPNVSPSNAAFTHGEYVEGLPYRPAKIIGGLWFMRRPLIDGLKFSNYEVTGILGAIAILRQIYSIKSPEMGWLPSVTFEDMGHWSGKHPDHIKTKEHSDYSHEVGREVSWAV